MEKHLICIDIDGTLVDGEGKIPEKNMEAIAKVIEQGHIVSIITGRPWRSTQHLYEELKLNTMVGNYNGALIHHPLNSKIKSIEAKVQKDIMNDILNDRKVKRKIHSFILENKDKVFISREDNSAMKQYAVLNADDYKVGMEHKKEFLNTDVTGALILIKRLFDPLKVRSYLTNKYGHLVDVNYWIEEKEGVVIDIGSKKAGKGKALRKFCQQYSIDIKNTIALGDSWNDVSMFEEAEIAVAMNQAKAETKNFADIISDYTNTECGVARYLDQHFKLNMKW